MNKKNYNFHPNFILSLCINKCNFDIIMTFRGYDLNQVSLDWYVQIIIGGVIQSSRELFNLLETLCFTEVGES